MNVNEIPKSYKEWHIDHGPVLWWTFPIVEPPYCGTPLDKDWTIGESLRLYCL
ncbi:hypothetical protein ERICIII_04807 (plasmid) [Paenibacillus larvae subsp. larvae]|uniref:Uncharacterized protein n=1 Tax=Paenibacillus larvae subsp. larvae TaxID=147375 RepID=A0A2L1U7B3_9BACL|nr:hypothetical protein ERICIII_04807 [Paenibacillus larvae subsp. larvae]